MPEFVFFTFVNETPLGISSLRRSLEQKGISTGIVNLSETGQRVLEETSELRGRERAAKANEIMEREVGKLRRRVGSAKFFGLAFYSTPAELMKSIPLAHSLKKIFPTAKLIGGGPAFNAYAKAVFSRAGLDYGIRGEAENAIVELVQRLKARKPVGSIEGLVRKKNGRIVVAQRPAMLTAEQFARMPVLTSEAGNQVIVYTERGCPFACIFCQNPRKNALLKVPVQKVLDALSALADSGGSIHTINFMNDSIFAERTKARQLLSGIISRKLNQKFRFLGTTTVDSLKTNGTVDRGLVRLLARANFQKLHLGIEALNDNILKELKSGRYSARSAISVTDALARAGISTHNFMLAGGVETRAIDFIESYYNMAAKSSRMKNAGQLAPPSFEHMNIIFGGRGTAIYENALAANSLVDSSGRATKRHGEYSLAPRYVVPKDPALRRFFLRQIRAHANSIQGPRFSEADYPAVVALAKKLGRSNQKAASLHRKLMQLQR